MALRKDLGTPVTGYVSLTNSAPGPVAFALSLDADGSTYTVGLAERLYITNIAVSTNDSALPLAVIDTGTLFTTRNVARLYGSPAYLAAASFAPGSCALPFGATPRASAAAVTAAKTVECVINGYVAKT